MVSYEYESCPIFIQTVLTEEYILSEETNSNFIHHKESVTT